jgi:hypothetical protein
MPDGFGFDDDPFASMNKDDRRQRRRSTKKAEDDFHNSFADFHESFGGEDGFGDFDDPPLDSPGESEEVHHHNQQQRRRTSRRASVAGGGGPTRVRSTRRESHQANNRSNRSLESLESSRPRRSGAKDGDRSVASHDRSVTSSATSGSGGSGGGQPARRRGRRASMHAAISSNPRTSRNASEEAPSEETGYGDGALSSRSSSADHRDEYGYGDAAPERKHHEEHGSKPIRSRRQRRCSIADVVSAPTNHQSTSDLGFNNEPPSAELHQEEGRPGVNRNSSGTSNRNLGGHTSQRAIGAAGPTANIAIPMADQEPQRKHRGRRGSMLGALALNKGRTKEAETAQVENKKASVQDRDRRRQGTLMDRVGSSSAAASSGRAGGSSYSDRIMSR